MSQHSQHHAKCLTVCAINAGTLAAHSWLSSSVSPHISQSTHISKSTGAGGGGGGASGGDGGGAGGGGGDGGGGGGGASAGASGGAGAGAGWRRQSAKCSVQRCWWWYRGRACASGRASSSSAAKVRTKFSLELRYQFCHWSLRRLAADSVPILYQVIHIYLVPDLYRNNNTFRYQDSHHLSHKPRPRPLLPRIPAYGTKSPWPGGSVIRILMTWLFSYDTVKVAVWPQCETSALLRLAAAAAA